MDRELSQGLVLQFLPYAYLWFIVNFHMNNLDVSLPKPLNILKTTKAHLVKDKGKILLMGGISKKKVKKVPKRVNLLIML